MLSQVVELASRLGRLSERGRSVTQGVEDVLVGQNVLMLDLKTVEVYTLDRERFVVI